MFDQARDTNYLFNVGQDRERSFNVFSANVTDIILGTTPFSTRDKQILIPGDQIENEPLMLQFNVSNDMNEWIWFYKWLLKAKNNEQIDDYSLDGTLISLDYDNQPACYFNYEHCYPTNITGISFNSQGESQVLTSSVTIQFIEFYPETKDGEIIQENWNGDL